MSHFQERIEDTQKKLDTTKGDIAEMMGLAEAEQRDLSDDESLQLEAYAKDVESLEKRLVDLERAEKAMANRVIEKQAPAIMQAKHLGGKEREKGEIIFKQATAAFIAHCTKTPIDVVAKNCYPADQGLQAVVKSVIDPAATDVAGWAQELVTDANQGFLDLLRGDFVTPRLWAAAGVNLNFDGLAAINIPSRAGTDTDMRGGFTGELSTLPVRRMTTATQQLVPYKWGCISSFSKELAARSTPSIQALVTQSIINDTGTALDQDYLGDGAANAGFRPAGLFNGVVGTAAATGGATVGDDMLLDLQNLINPFYAANLQGGIFIMIHPSNRLAMETVLYNGTYLFRNELANGTLLGIPIIQSTNIPIDELQAVVMSAQAVASSAPMFDVSDSATLTMVDDDAVAPNMGADYPRDPTGAIGLVTTPVTPYRSLFQSEAVAVKMVQYLSWGTLRDSSVNRITGVAYVS